MITKKQRYPYLILGKVDFAADKSLHPPRKSLLHPKPEFSRSHCFPRELKAGLFQRVPLLTSAQQCSSEVHNLAFSSDIVPARCPPPKGFLGCPTILPNQDMRLPHVFVKQGIPNVLPRTNELLPVVLLLHGLRGSACALPSSQISPRPKSFPQS